MAKTVKVPFELHRAVTPHKVFEIPEGVEVALNPDGRTAALIAGRWGNGRLLLLDLAAGAVEDALPGRAGLQHVVWATAGDRWAAVGEARAGGVAYVGERGRAAPLCEVATPTYGAMGRNDLSRPSPTVALSPDGARAVVRSVLDHGDRSALYHVDVGRGALREQALDPDEGHPFAQCFRDDGALVTLCASPGDTSGMAVYAPGDDRVAARLPHVAGYALVPTPKGLWALGLPRYGHRVAPGEAAPPSACHDERLQRVEALAGRARAAWDKQHVVWLRERVARKDIPFNYDLSATCVRVGVAPPPTEGVRCHENLLLWDTARAARWRDDVIVSDGIGVWRWRADDRGLRQDLLMDDPQHATHRTARVLSLSVAGDTLALLWKKDAAGAKTILTLFELSPALAEG